MTVDDVRFFGTQPENAGSTGASSGHDACGVAMVATLRGHRGTRRCRRPATALTNLDHRGATGAPIRWSVTGLHPNDAGRSRMPFPARSPASVLPPAGSYARRVGLPARRRRCARHDSRPHPGTSPRRRALRSSAGAMSPVVPARRAIGARARCRISPQRLFVTASDGAVRGIHLDRRAYCLRKRAPSELDVWLRLAVRAYRGLGDAHHRPAQPFFPRPVRRPLRQRTRAVVHSRFSTNTFPSWPARSPTG